MSKNAPNGCGPHWMSKKLKDKYFEEACKIHDEDYLDPSKNNRDREEADRVFYKEMLKKVEKEPNYFIRQLRRIQAEFYYRVVRVFGWTSHKDGLDI